MNNYPGWFFLTEKRFRKGNRKQVTTRLFWICRLFAGSPYDVSRIHMEASKELTWFNILCLFRGHYRGNISHTLLWGHFWGHRHVLRIKIEDVVPQNTYLKLLSITVISSRKLRSSIIALQQGRQTNRASLVSTHTVLNKFDMQWEENVPRKKYDLLSKETILTSCIDCTFEPPIKTALLFWPIRLVLIVHINLAIKRTIH